MESPPRHFETLVVNQSPSLLLDALPSFKLQGLAHAALPAGPHHGAGVPAFFPIGVLSRCFRSLPMVWNQTVTKDSWGSNRLLAVLVEKNDV